MTDETSPDREPMGPTDPDGAVEPERRTAGTSTGVAWGVVFLFIGIALVVVFAVQNTDAVAVKFLWMDGTFSLAIVILITVGAAILITELVGISYRRRRRRSRAERDELRRLRGDT
jgi:uncharacterized integral membrane protein